MIHPQAKKTDGAGLDGCASRAGGVLKVRESLPRQVVPPREIGEQVGRRKA
jgi:hypothetical protein